MNPQIRIQGSNPSSGAFHEGLSDSFKAREEKISLTMHQIQQATIPEFTQKQLEKSLIQLRRASPEKPSMHG
jgi:hypothetical protein